MLGLEEGSLPRRGAGSPFLDDEAREKLGGRLHRADQVSRDRYLFYTACSRPTRRLYLVRESATDANQRWEEAGVGVAVFSLEMPCEQLAKLSGFPSPRTMYERAPIDPGMMPSSPFFALTAPLRVRMRSSPKCVSCVQ